jgi:hypothetical protein
LFFVFILFSNVASAQLSEDTLAKRKGEGLLGRFKGSYFSLTHNLGTGTFIRDSYSDNPYVSQELLFYPRFKLRPNMDVRLYWVLECELTAPDNPTGRHCSPSDLRLSYHHTKLWTDPWIDGRVMGSFQVWLPSSYESRFNNTVMNLRAAGTYFVRFFKGKLEAAYSFAMQKYLPYRKTRGYTAGDEGTGDDGLPLYTVRSSAGEDASAGSGGAMNDNMLFINQFHLALNFLEKFQVSMNLLIYNYLRFGVPDEFSDPHLLGTGRADWTWGIIEASYQPLSYLVVALGISSLQPALTADAKNVRFPFYDFVSPHENYTKWYLAATVLY